MGNKHARLSPSNHRWVYCPGSIREEENYEEVRSIHSISGTVTHLLLEDCLKNNKHPSEYLNKKIVHRLPLRRLTTNSQGNTLLKQTLPPHFLLEDLEEEYTIDQDRINRVVIAWDYVERRKKEIKQNFPLSEIKLELESRSDVGKIFDRDDWWGTVDITITAVTNDTLDYMEVIDYKDGVTFVSVEKNPQLLAYLAGKISLTCSSLARMTIVQPKTNPQIRYKDISINDLCLEVTQLHEAALKTDNENAPLIPDDENGKGYCKFCKHKDNCQPLKEKKLRSLKMFNSIQNLLENVEKLSEKELSQLLDTKTILDEIFEKAQQLAESKIKDGNSIPGYAVLPGNSIKKWRISEEELIKKLRAMKIKKEEMYTTKFISPAQALKLPITNKQKERIQNEYIDNVKGKLKLKKVSKNYKSPIDELKHTVLQCNTSFNKFL